MSIENKFMNLKELLKSYRKVVIAYSGGVDSTFLAKVATEVLGDDALCVTVHAEIHSDDEINDSSVYARTMQFNQVIRKVSIIDAGFIRKNPIDRCYHCKRFIFGKMLDEANAFGTDYVLDGSNADDTLDYRPGMKALKELGVKSPLLQVGLTKDEIRLLSARYNLPTAHKPAFACLASRIPYNNSIDITKLKQIEAGEQFLSQRHFRQYRVRHHEDIARIEIAPEERRKLFDEKLWVEIDEAFRTFGFKYVAIDTGGYKTGNMNKMEGITSIGN